MRFKNFEVTGQLHKTMRREACKPRAQNKAKKAIERRAAAAECTRVIYQFEYDFRIYSRPQATNCGSLGNPYLHLKNGYLR